MVKDGRTTHGKPTSAAPALLPSCVRYRNARYDFFRYVKNARWFADQSHRQVHQTTWTPTFQHAWTFSSSGINADGDWEHRRALFFKNLAYHFPVNGSVVAWLFPGRVTYGRRVGVHQNDAVTLFAIRYLRARESSACLTDSNRAHQNQDTFYICTFWHGSFTPG